MKDIQMHAANKHYQSAFDFPLFEGDPTRLLMLASMPRSGSTFLALEMWRKGILGSPLEYFNFQLIHRVGRWRHCVLDLNRYWRDIRRLRTSPNGVFSFKMFPANYTDIANLNEDFLSEICPAKIIYLERQDKLAQAISYSKAIQSGAWFSGVEESRPAGYSREHIAECLATIERQERFWERAFEMTGADVLKISYEDIINDSENILGRIIDFVGVSILTEAHSEINIQHLDVQRDSSSLEWADQYLASKD